MSTLINHPITYNPAGLSATPVQPPVDSQVTVGGDQGTTESTAGAGTGSSVFRCETCSTVFDTLDHFMDHRNFVCTSGMGELQFHFYCLLLLSDHSHQVDYFLAFGICIA